MQRATCWRCCIWFTLGAQHKPPLRDVQRCVACISIAFAFRRFCCCYCHMQHLSGSTALVVSLKCDCEFFHASFEALCRTSRLLLCFCRCCWCDCLCCGCCCHCSAVGWSVYRFDVVSMPLWAGKGARQWIKAHKASRVTAREEEGRRSKKN